MRLALALGAGAFVLYLSSLPPSFAFWDTGELQTVAAILGIAHPPACPAFVLLGWSAVHLFPFGEPAWRVDAMCALAMAGSVALLALVARRMGLAPLTCALVTIGFAVALVPWRDATRAEVQDVALLFRVAALYFGLRYLDAGERRDLFFAALACGLAGATHGIAVLLLPAFAIFVVARGAYREPRAMALVAGGFALGLLPYVYLPLRSAAVAAAHLDPTVTLGLAPGAQPFWDYDHPATWTNFVRVLTAADFDVHSGFAGFAHVAEYPRFAGAMLVRFAEAYGFAGALLAAIGGALLLARREAGAVALVVAALLPVPYTESYNELQEPDRYYLLTLWCAAIAMGVTFERVAEILAIKQRGVGRLVLAGGLIVSLTASSPDRGRFFLQRNDRNAQRYVNDVAAETPDNAIVVAEWAYATPLAYASYVDGRFGRRIVITAAPDQFVKRYRSWLGTRPVYVVSFDDALKLRGFDARSLGSQYFHSYEIALPRALPRARARVR
ncbi:MAG: DUF2723 domain-containing protein [Candidatus Eremiobacteraeota bacterium]|nr:DUF2723 domain-containing protein [Candidatus Eremiobacteraeota bacterium]